MGGLWRGSSLASADSDGQDLQLSNSPSAGGAAPPWRATLRARALAQVLPVAGSVHRKRRIDRESGSNCNTLLSIVKQQATSRQITVLGIKHFLLSP
ncbi:unnamed protein product [Miscanthus lutarioriparius]|uniref:Uncharacterized protein n=1 Tax=Miscanthus lutarioriparius TaxID=422564 RepID=A0A811PVB1_9POAL|nr:unnamed protein product [Miscanthus lutarioriparius]